jgi:hypothetical protein
MQNGRAQDKRTYVDERFRFHFIDTQQLSLIFPRYSED